MPVILLRIPQVQETIATRASNELSRQLNVPVNVGKVNIEWLSRLVLRDVSLADQGGEPLFEAGHLSAGFKIFPLFQKKWIFTNIRLFHFSLHLKKDTPDGALNLQFLIDAFASKDTTSTPDIELQIHSILFHHGEISYHDSRAPEHPAFDARHLQILDLNGKIALEIAGKDSLNLHVRKLSFRERSGFRLDNLTTEVTGNRQEVALTDLNIRLPETLLQITGASLRRDSAGSLTEAPLELHLAPSQVGLRDFSAFAPVLAHFTDRVEVAAEVSGQIDDLTVNKLTLKQNGTLSLLGQMEVKEIRHPEKTYLFGRIDRLYLSVDKLASVLNHFQEKRPVLPEQVVQRLTHLTFNGEISGFTDHLVACGNLHSDIGSIQMDMLIGHKKDENIAFYLKGEAASSELKINELFEEGNPYGIVRFKAGINAAWPVNGLFAGDIQAQVYQLDYRKYRYENILLSGNFGRKEFNGRIDMDDANGKLHAEGFFKNNDGQRPAFRFFAGLTDFRPDKLFLTDKYEDPQLSLTLAADFTGNHPDNFNGRIAVNDFSFHTRSDTFHLDSLYIRAGDDTNGRKLTVTSDLVNAEVGGTYSFASLWPSLLKTVHTCLPSLPLKEYANIHDNAFYLIMTVGNTEALSKTFHLPFANIEQGHLSGQYDNLRHTLRINALLPKFRIGKSVFEYGSVELDNPEGVIRMQARTTFINRKKARNLLQVNSEASGDHIRTSLTWENNPEHTDNGIKVDISTSMLFVSDKSEDGKQTLRTEITLEPNRLTLRDSIWHMEPASITIINGNMTVDNFYISKGDQYLRINGTASAQNPREAIQLDLNDIELSHVFDVVNIRALQFGGRATGTVSLQNLYGTPAMNAVLEVQNFSFNRAVQGRLNLTGEWDNDEERIQLLGTIYKNDTTYTDVHGDIYPVGAKAGISLHFNANDINLALLYPYVDAFSPVVEGRAFGHVHLFGAFSKLSFEGEALVKDGRIGVDFLHTDYAFSDSIHLSPTSIRGENITVSDKNGNRGAVSFDVQYKYLKDFSYQVHVQAQNLLIYDVPEPVDPQIYGTVYGSGNAQIKGNDQLVTIDANLQSSAGTNMGFNFMNGSTAGEYDFIRFGDLQDADRQPALAGAAQLPNDGDDDGAEVRVNCLVDVTPDANLELVMDPTSGDKIRGAGSGDIRIQYGSRTNLALYGGYTIRNGSYNFSLQQVIRKDFQIREGSRIDFRGDPMDANLSLNAIYFLTANIEDLDQSLGKETLRTSIPVNCVLNLNGRLQSPTISFDMELPNSTGELARQVKSFIDTEDMMARQIVYLLALNKFYTPDYSRNDFRSNEFSAVASSALSSQLSNILNSLTDKVQIGTNIRSRQDGFTDTEVEMLLSSQLLDNRLLFNGNFGYKNYMIQTNAFIGEFDLEYKLTPGGEIRLKAYNHANDMYRYNMKSLTRQGVGVMFHKDFSYLTEIFRRRKRTVPATDTVPASR
ncbi:MAG: translocation/assembly module TamB domain-containing protein [Tannerella sp.]|nr:translocation/assembly module TamB domain-containing protein [Tannerella sp.]